MSSSFGETVSPTAAIKGILSTYPFSSGLLREILQNSDDAGASKQVFLLDWRQHASGTLFHDYLAVAQGPALLAFNDAMVGDKDWNALQTIYQSSKVVDDSKIGKYGIGFRACYHVTDSPQILSGSHLALLDPHCDFSEGGKKLDITLSGPDLADQLSPFDCFRDAYDSGTSGMPGSFDGAPRAQPFPATVIRLPLRTAGGRPSLISPTVVSPEEIRQLFQDFIEKEIDEVMLFLSHVVSVELHEIDALGQRSILAGASLEAGPAAAGACAVPRGMALNESRIYRATVTVEKCEGSPAHKSWLMVHTSFPQDEAVGFLSSRVSTDVDRVLSEEKMKPEVGLAIPDPSPGSARASCSSRLFTFLPLPIPTGFPCHIHAVFALTSSRQNLRNANETGLVSGSKDSLLVQWNRLLFEKFIPRAYAIMLLAVSSSSVDDYDVFSAWPPAQSATQTGDSFYWRTLPNAVTQEILRHQLAIWPLARNSTPIACCDCPDVPLHAALEDVFVAEVTEDPTVVATLASAGVMITRPPQHIRYELVGSSLTKSLNAIYIHESLVSKQHELLHVQRNATERRCILSYLASTRIVACLRDIPLFQTMQGDFVCLRLQGSADVATRRTHVLLDWAEAGLFDGCAPSALSYRDMPDVVGTLLRESGPATLNVQALTPTVIRCYVLSRLEMTGSAASSDSVDIAGHRAWLAQFWSWVSKRSDWSELWLEICDLKLLPATHGELLDVAQGIIALSGSMPEMVAHGLRTLGVYILHHDLSSLVPFFRRVGITKSSLCVHALLDRVDGAKASALEASHLVALRDYFFSNLSESIRTQGSLTGLQQRALRCMPFFPMLDPSTPEEPGVHSRLGCLSEDCTVLCLGTVTVVPSIVGMVFLDASLVDAALLPFVQIGAPAQRLDEYGMLSMAVEFFPQQSTYVQRVLLDVIVKKKEHLAANTLNSLGQSHFVSVRGPWEGTPRFPPKCVIDPQSALANIWSMDGLSRFRLPTIWDDDSRMIVGYLRKLGLLQGELTEALLRDRLTWFSACQAPSDVVIGQAKCLLGLLCNSNPCLYQSTDLAGHRWLPTAAGLRCSSDCHHASANHPDLFDEALLTLDFGYIPLPLRRALAWDQPLSVSVLKDQLSCVLQCSRNSEKLRHLIKEFSIRAARGDLSSEDVDDLRQRTSSASWIPISQSLIVPTERALTTRALATLPGFHCIPTDWSMEMTQFLARMGCRERPLNSTVLTELERLAGGRQANDTSVSDAVALLQGLNCESMACDERARLLIPDATGTLRPSNEVYFNDLGDRAFLAELPSGTYLAHPRIYDDFARDLGLTRIGLLKLEFFGLDAGDDMGEDLTTRVSTVLRQYPQSQSFNEFIANAVDAGANDVRFLVDDMRFSDCSILSTSMARYQREPALVIYNNSVFTDADWKGIRSVGRGGKSDQPASIGQFGLGALSMFHFTEMAMIVSGATVMFLHPSKRDLPAKHRASIMLPLALVRKSYNDQLSPLDGLFGFDKTVSHYDGSLFRLPLRDAQQVEDSPLVASSPGRADLARLLSTYHDTAASHALFFTSLESVSVDRRDSAGAVERLWSLRGRSNVVANSRAYKSSLLSVSRSDLPFAPDEAWRIVSVEIPHNDLPDRFMPLVAKHRLRLPVTAAIAAEVVKPVAALAGSIAAARMKFFSYLPLPMESSLPVHVHASFLLADDRRSIRFDDAGTANLESQYNHWILDAVIPSLYGDALHELLIRDQSASAHWPGAVPPSDQLSSTLIDAFYTNYLPSNDVPLLRDVQGQVLRPRDAIAYADISGVSDVLRVLRPHGLVHLPAGVGSKICRSAPTGNITPHWLSDAIRLEREVFRAAWRDGQPGFNPENVGKLVRYLTWDDKQFPTGASLVGLPLLPLADGTLATFRELEACDPVYAWILPCVSELFPTHRLVHGTFSSTARQLVTYDLNVKIFKRLGLQRLLRLRFPRPSGGRTLSSDDELWVQSFWNNYDDLVKETGITVEDLREFPLVPTPLPHRFVSMGELDSSTVIFTTESDPSSLGDTLQRLGAVEVARDTCHEALRGILDIHDPLPHRTLRRIITFFDSYDAKTLVSLFSQLGVEDRALFSDWITREISFIPERGWNEWRLPLDCARKLPVWSPGHTSNAPHPAVEFVCAASAIMLPRGAQLSICRPFLPLKSTYFQYSLALHRLGSRILTQTELIDLLCVPHNLPVDRLPEYKLLLPFLIEHCDRSQWQVKVPDRLLRMTPANALYSSSNALFRTAFQSRPWYFIAEGLESLEDSLTMHCGLHTRVDQSTFRECANAIDCDAEALGASPRAEAVFHFYCHELPLMAGSNPSFWSTLDNLRFVPRQMLRNPAYSPDDLSFVRDLPWIVSPNEVLHPALTNIAWTQRAIAQVALSDALTIANPNFGIPGVGEMIEHLRVLALRISKRYTRDDRIANEIHDVYSWLNTSNRAQAAADYLTRYPHEALWLNIEDRSDPQWQWCTCDELLFNIYDAGGHFNVREFLIPFKLLLQSAGVLEIRNPPVSQATASDGDLDIQTLRAVFQKMRSSEKLVDVSFFSNSGTRYPAHRQLLVALDTEYFWDLFCGHFTESDASFGREVRTEYSDACLSMALNYVYCGWRNMPENDAFDDRGNVLVEVMHLSHYWGLVQLHALVQREIIASKFIMVDNLDALKEHAETLNAQELQEACRYFEDKNAVALRKVRSSINGT